MIKAVLDTNYLIGLIDEKDIHHHKASLIEEELIKVNAQYVYLDCVINEIVNVIVRRFNERKRLKDINYFIEKLQTICPKENITWMYQELDRFYNSVINMVKNNHGVLNFHDAFIVHIANELEIPYIVSFDKGFDKTNLKRIKNTGDII